MTMMDITALCNYLSCARNAIYCNIKKGNLPAPLKIGKLSRWVKEDVDQWIRDNNNKTANAKTKK
jgi:excisionase family DNA binding protein